MFYAVAGTFTKRISSGLNIVCAIRKLEAISSDEAAGKFIRIMSEELPEHNIHVRPVFVALEDDKEQVADVEATTRGHSVDCNCEICQSERCGDNIC